MTESIAHWSALTGSAKRIVLASPVKVTPFYLDIRSFAEISAEAKFLQHYAHKIRTSIRKYPRRSTFMLFSDCEKIAKADCRASDDSQLPLQPMETTKLVQQLGLEIADLIEPWLVLADFAAGSFPGCLPFSHEILHTPGEIVVSQQLILSRFELRGAGFSIGSKHLPLKPAKYLRLRDALTELTLSHQLEALGAGVARTPAWISLWPDAEARQMAAGGSPETRAQFGRRLDYVRLSHELTQTAWPVSSNAEEVLVFKKESATHFNESVAAMNAFGCFLSNISDRDIARDGCIVDCHKSVVSCASESSPCVVSIHLPHVPGLTDMLQAAATDGGMAQALSGHIKASGLPIFCNQVAREHLAECLLWPAGKISREDSRLSYCECFARAFLFRHGCFDADSERLKRLVDILQAGLQGVAQLHPQESLGGSRLLNLQTPPDEIVCVLDMAPQLSEALKAAAACLETAGVSELLGRYNQRSTRPDLDLLCAGASRSGAFLTDWISSNRYCNLLYSNSELIFSSVGDRLLMHVNSSLKLEQLIHSQRNLLIQVARLNGDGLEKDMIKLRPGRAGLWQSTSAVAGSDLIVEAVILEFQKARYPVPIAPVLVLAR